MKILKFIDGWTIVHVIAGFLSTYFLTGLTSSIFGTGLHDWRTWIVALSCLLIISFVWELREHRKGVDKYVLSSVFDTIANFFGSLILYLLSLI